MSPRLPLFHFTCATALVYLLLAAALSAPARALVAPATPAYFTTWGVSGGAPGQFNGPWGCATDARGNLYVVDRFNGRVQEFDPQGNLRVTFGGMTGPLYAAIDPAGNVYVPDNYVVNKFAPSGVLLQQWGSQGNGAGQFQAAAGIALDAAANVYVSDYQLNRVQKFTASGVFVSQWGSTGSGAGQLQNPTGICTDAAGDLYVADLGNNRIEEFTGAGVYVGQWGSAGSGNGQFANPASVSTDAVGNFYVGDESNHRVQKFSPTGAYLAQFGSFGTGNGQFNDPVGTAVDPAGNVIVADYGNSRVQEFSGAGAAWEMPWPGFLGAWGSAGSGPGQFGSSLCLATDRIGNVYVSDAGNSRIEKFKGDGTLLQQWGSPGTGTGQFSNNSGAAVADSGAIFSTDWIYVADPGNGRIQAFTTTGVYLLSWSTNVGGVSVSHPRYLAFDGSAHLYVTDNLAATQRVVEFTAGGGFVTQWGTGGSGSGQFSNALGIAVDPMGYVDVADNSNSRIEKFTGSGTFVAQWGSFGGSPYAPIVRPQGLAIDAAGHVLEADAGVDYVEAYTGTGTWRGMWSQPVLGGSASFSGLTDVAFARSGDFYVASSGNHQVFKFAQPPVIALVSDVPADQGGKVTLRILRASADAANETLPVIRYDVYRRIDPLLAPASAQPVKGAFPAAVELAGWDQVAAVTANGSAEYDVVVPTLENATQGTPYYNAFLVRAATSDPYTFVSSVTAYGYSIDNLAPSAPSPFKAAYVSGGTHLHWGENSAADFATFRLYRGTSAGFTPGPANLVAATTDTGYVDIGPAGRWYAISAVDVNGNESSYALIGPNQTTDAPGPAPLVFALERPWPNPALGGRLNVRFTLPDASAARLELLDVTGRAVAARDVGALGAGEHALDLTENRRLAPGLYFVRLTQGAKRMAARVTVLE